MRALSKLFAIVLGLIGLGVAGGGAWLIGLGGSFYYLIAGLAYVVAAFLLLRGRASGGLLVALVAILTVPWALWEAGLNFWPLFSRLMAPLALAGFALLFTPAAAGLARRGLYYVGALASLVLFAAGIGFAFQPHGVVSPSAEITAYKPAAGDNTPANWTAYGRTTAGLRYSPFDQISRDNVGNLELAWTYRTGRGTIGMDQNTPLQIDDLVYSCTTSNVVIALDGDTGAERWKFDPTAKGPFWQRCRGLGYYKLPAEQQVAGQACNERIIGTTIDARMYAIDAKTGQLCAGFGNNGIISLGENMGEVIPGFYFQTSAPLVARDKVVVGGWVVDNQMVGEPSGVIRAFNVDDQTVACTRFYGADGTEQPGGHWGP